MKSRSQREIVRDRLPGWYVAFCVKVDATADCISLTNRWKYEIYLPFPICQPSVSYRSTPRLRGSR